MLLHRILQPNPEAAAQAGPRGAVFARAVAAQTAAFTATWLLSAALDALSGTPLPWQVAAVADGLAAAAIGHSFGLPRWWRPINFALPLMGFAAVALEIDPHWFLLALIATFLVYGTIFRTSVPLYFSGRDAVSALCSLLDGAGPRRILDAGSGIGTLLAGLSTERPHGDSLQGVEAAFLPWLVSRARALWGGGRYSVAWGDLWDVDFGRYDLVYAFLSPVPMPKLWEKARREMRPGTLLVSNSFAIPGVAPVRSVELGDGGRTLYVWRM